MSTDGDQLPDNDPQTGRFRAGNRGNAGGNPTKRRERMRNAAYRMLFDQLAKDNGENLRQIVDSWIDDAKANQTARRHLLDRLLGRAAELEAQQQVEKLERMFAKLQGAKP